MVFLTLDIFKSNRSVRYTYFGFYIYKTNNERIVGIYIIMMDKYLNNFS